MIQRPLDKKEFRKKAQSAVPVSKEKARKRTHLSILWLLLVTVEGLVLPEWEGKSE